MKKGILSILIILIILFGGCEKKTDEQTLDKDNENLAEETELDESDNTNMIKIAVILAKTGAAAITHENMFKVMQLAEEEINANGGILGREIEIIEIDNQSTSIGAKNAAETAVLSDVIAVIGCARSSNSLAAAPILQKAGIIMISPSSTNPEVTLVGDYIFRICFLDSLQGKIMANFAINELNCRSAVVLTNTSYSYSMDLSEYFIKQYIALGGEILWVGDFIENMSDFSSLLSGIKELNPDVIYLPAYVRDSGFIIRQAREMGISSVFLGGDGWGPEIFEYGLDDVNGSYLTDHWYYELDRNNSMEFVRKFEDKFNTRPSSGSALTYDAISILLYAIEQAGTFDSETIRKHLAIIEDFNGITGDISFDENGNPIKSAVILKLENNERVFVKYIEP